MKRIVKNIIRRDYEAKLTLEIKNKNWEKSICNIPDLPRSFAVAAFRLETGHDCLAKYLSRINIYKSPLCVLCKQNFEMDKDHLSKCTSLKEDNLYNRYWEAREMMQSMSTD